MGYQDIGKNIKRYRRANHITQEDFAEMINVTQQSVSAWECGAKIPSPEMWELIADALNIPETALFSSNLYADVMMLADIAVKSEYGTAEELAKLREVLQKTVDSIPESH